MYDICLKIAYKYNDTNIRMLSVYVYVYCLCSNRQEACKIPRPRGAMKRVRFAAMYDFMNIMDIYPMKHIVVSSFHARILIFDFRCIKLYSVLESKNIFIC